MITTIVSFKLPVPMTLPQAQAAFSASAPRYKNLPGLVRKYYLLSEDGRTAGGVYLWHSRRDAERCYTDEWRKFILDKYGCEPTVAYFRSPVVVDNSREPTVEYFHTPGVVDSSREPF